MLKIKRGEPAFIVFEGIDGSGKTTQSKRLFQYLFDRGYPVKWFREPSESKWGKEIRDLALKEDSISKEKELVLFIKDREWNVKNNLIPWLKKNYIVIFDRYFYSTAAYQGARGFDYQIIIKKNLEFAPIPDLVFFIDVEVEVGLNRIKKNRREIAELFETEEFLTKVREIYFSLDNKNIVRINGNKEEDQVFLEILKILSQS